MAVGIYTAALFIASVDHPTLFVSAKTQRIPLRNALSVFRRTTVNDVSSASFPHHEYHSMLATEYYTSYTLRMSPASCRGHINQGSRMKSDIMPLLVDRSDENFLRGVV